MAVWAGIVRVSSMGGRKVDAADFHSERDQLAALRKAVTDVGGTLELLPSELDVSGARPLDERPSLRRAVEGVESGRYAGIVFAYQSRLGRDVEIEEQVWRRVEHAGGKILLALDGIDASTVDGKMVRRIRAAINTRERDAHVERFDQLRRVSTEHGIWQRRQLPLGYGKDPATRKLVPNGAAPKVRAAYAARAAGVTTSEIARTLRMTSAGARALLRNRVYLGELHVGKYQNRPEHAHPAIVDENVWMAAQHPTPVRAPRSMPEVALLGGLVRCCGCGHVMSRTRTGSIVYTCHGASSAGQCPARAAITTRSLDEYVDGIALRALAGLPGRPIANRKDAEVAREQRRTAERELGAYLEAVSAADVGAEAFATGARKRREVVDHWRGEEQRAIAAQAPAVPLEVVEAYPSLSVTHRNRLLRGLIECVLVQRAGRGQVVPVGDRVRVIGRGAGIVDGPYRGGGKPLGIRSIDLPELDDPRVLGV